MSQENLHSPGNQSPLPTARIIHPSFLKESSRSQLISNDSFEGSPDSNSNNGFFHSPHFELLQQNLRDLERSVSPFAIPSLGNLVYKEDSNTNQGETSLDLGANYHNYIQEQIDLRIASSNNITAVLELDMDGNVRHLSNNWTEIVGTSIKKIVNRPISKIIIGSDDDDSMVFHKAIEQMVKDDGTYKVKFITPTNNRSKVYENSDHSDKLTPHNSLTDLTDDFQLESPYGDLLDEPSTVMSNDGDIDTDIDQRTVSSLSTNGEVIELEAQGILIHDQATNLPTHSMWSVKPFFAVNLNLQLPQELIDLLGLGAEFFEGYLTNLNELGIINEESVPQPKTVFCRICEQNIPVWFMEKHNELCLVEHKWNDELQEKHDAISEQKEILLKILDSYWLQLQVQLQNLQKTRTSPKGSNSSSHLGSPNSLSPHSLTSSLSGSSSFITEYKGIPLPPLSSMEFSQPSSLLNTKKFPFGILQRLIELCDEALQINPKEESTNKDSLSLSPNTSKAIDFVNNWKAFETNDPAIRSLVEDTQRLTKDKVEALSRLMSFLQYFKKIGNQVDELVLKVLRETVEEIKEKTYLGEESINIDAEGHLLEIESGKAGELLPYQYKSIEDSKSPLFNSPQMSQSKMFEDSNMLRRSTSPLNTNRQNVSLTPKDFLLKSKSGLDLRDDFKRSSSSSSLSKEAMKNLVDSLGDVDVRRSRDGSSSPSLPRRHLSPAPYVERQSLSSLQRTNLDNGGNSLGSGKTTATSPLIIASDLRNDSIASSSDLSGSLPPHLQTTEKRSNSGGSNYSHQVPTSTLNFSGPPSAKSSISRPPLSPLLVSQSPATKPISASIKDYDVLKAISKGAFGSVFLARKKVTGDYVAIKVLKKNDMIAKNQILNVKSERAVMMKQSDSPYVAQLYNTFQTKDYLYLVMEYLPGGDVAALLKVIGTLGDDWAKFYIAEVIVGIDDLHERGIIHRDLKPDNLLIDLNGHLKLTDFGLSRMGVVGRQKRPHRKSSSSEQNIEMFRKSIGPGLSPLVTVSQHANVNINNSPLETHKRTSSVTPFSLSPTLDQIKGSYISNSSSPSSSTTHENQYTYRGSISSAQNQKLVSRSNSTVSGNGLESPLLNAAIPRTNSETSMTFLDDEVQNSPSRFIPPVSYALYDPQNESEAPKKFVGTPDYLAPETIKGVGQSEASDWWAVGCILFEFHFGYPPFHAETPDEVFSNILECRIDWPELPEEEELEICPPKAKALIKRLLILNPDERLGNNGADEIKSDPYFEDINWDSLFNGEASFVPQPENPESTDYFDARGADMSLFPTDDMMDQPMPQESGADQITSTSILGSPSISASQSSLTVPGVKRERRGSRLADTTEFGSFNFRNLSVLEKANKDVINRLKNEHLEHKNSFSSSSSESMLSRGQSFSGGQPSSPFKAPISPLLLRSQSPVKRDTNPAGSPGASSASNSMNTQGSFGSATNSPGMSLAPLTGNSSVLGSHLTHERVGSSASTYSSGDEFPFEFNKGSSNSERPFKGSVDLSHSIAHKSSVSSLSKQVLKFSEYSPASSDNEETKSSALLRIQKRRQSGRRPGSFTFSDGRPLFSDLDVLYCELIPIVRLSISRLLEKQGCNVVAVADGDEFVRRATSQVKFDVIFTALRLPKVEAPDAIKLIRFTTGVNSKTPIIAITGFAKEAIMANCFNDVLEKPIDSGMLRSCLLRTCNWAVHEDDDAIEWDNEKM